MSSSTVKSRHYQALANRVKQLQANLGETEVAMDLMAERLQDMQRLGINSASQFMAVSRLLDTEMLDHNSKINAQDAQAAPVKQ